MTRNSEGLTFSEWYNAASAFGLKLSKSVARVAWAEGEDPTEYAALSPEKAAKAFHPKRPGVNLLGIRR